VGGGTWEGVAGDHGDLRPLAPLAEAVELQRPPQGLGAEGGDEATGGRPAGDLRHTTDTREISISLGNPFTSFVLVVFKKNTWMVNSVSFGSEVRKTTKT